MSPCGIVVLDKPEGPTSHDMVRLARRLLHTRQVGHTGTLDPMATGVLVLCIGRATRLARFLTAGEKIYQARLHLGQDTDTYDRTGNPVGPPRPVQVTEQQVRAVLAALGGRRMQRPPAFSAKRIDGVRSHLLARAGAPREPAPAEIEIRGFRSVRLEGDELAFEVRCSSGTYVRSLAREIGEQLGCGANLTELRRTGNGEFDIGRAISPAELETRVAAVGPQAALLATGDLSLGMPGVRVLPPELLALAHGRALHRKEWQGSLGAGASRCRILGPDGALLAIADVEESPDGVERLLPRLVLIQPREAADLAGPEAAPRPETA